jgi:hypothetical protein
MSTSRKKEIRKLTDIMSPDAVKLISARGDDLVREIGIEVIRGIVHDVLSGENLRDSTEMLTRRRIAALNLATVEMFIRESAVSADFIQDLPQLGSEMLHCRRLAKPERSLAEWILGLTHKAFQNVLRDNIRAIDEYRNRYVEICQEVISMCEREYGALSRCSDIINPWFGEVSIR